MDRGRHGAWYLHDEHIGPWLALPDTKALPLTELRPVRVVASRQPSARTIVFVVPDGCRIEGLAVSDLVALVRGLRRSSAPVEPSASTRSQSLSIFAMGTTGSSALVKQGLERDPLSGDLFLFVNARRTSCKVLVWDGTGLCIFQRWCD